MQLPTLPPNLKKHRLGSWRWLIALLVVVTIWGFVDVRRRGYYYPQTPQEHRTDLTVYTEAGWAFLNGGEPYEVANPRGWTYLYPPLFALLLAPLHVLPTQDQVTVWFFISLLFCWGCYRECRRIVEIVLREDAARAAAWARWFPWLGVAAVAVALLPTLNCLQRGQVGLLKLYLLLLGVRLVLGGRTYRSWLAGGIVLAMAVVLKIIPVLPVGFLLLLQLADFVRKRRARPTSPEPVGRRFAASTLGVSFGLVLFFFLVPAALIGWDANLRHLDTWARFMLTKADDGGMDPRSGNSHSARNQSLQNAIYRFGNFTAHVAAGGPDDRLVEEFQAPAMAMDLGESEKALLLARGAGVGAAAVGHATGPWQRQPAEPGHRFRTLAGGHVGCLARGARPLLHAARAGHDTGSPLARWAQPAPGRRHPGHHRAGAAHCALSSVPLRRTNRPAGLRNGRVADGRAGAHGPGRAFLAPCAECLRPAGCARGKSGVSNDPPADASGHFPLSPPEAIIPPWEADGWRWQARCCCSAVAVRRKNRRRLFPLLPPRNPSA